MKFAFAALAACLFITVSAYADGVPDQILNVSVQGGVNKCIPTGNGAVLCNTSLVAPVNMTITLHCTYANICDSGILTVPLTSDDQTFIATYEIRQSGDYFMTASFTGAAGQLPGSFNYDMGNVFSFPGPITITAQPQLVVRDPLETDSYQPVLVFTPPASN